MNQNVSKAISDFRKASIALIKEVADSQEANSNLEHSRMFGKAKAGMRTAKNPKITGLLKRTACTLRDLYVPSQSGMTTIQKLVECENMIAAFAEECASPVVIVDVVRPASLRGKARLSVAR